MNTKLEKIKIAVIGLGYVGLPLLVSFSKKFDTIGYDLNLNKITKYKKDYKLNIFTNKHEDIKNYNFFIICVPTPLLKNNKPDLNLLKNATILVSKYLSKNSIVVFESTVYPGVTEDICIPILEKKSKLKNNLDFYTGYSPERINPGDSSHQLENIKKVVSGSNQYSANIINKVYKKIIKAGTYLAPNIKVAEAAKVIENTQRDINIAFINELSIIFDKMNINTIDVLKAAETKWNFLNFKPGLVGGHCIGVDPYYLSYISSLNGYKPKMILSGRQTNEFMPRFVFNKLIKIFKEKKLKNKKINIIISGITFKENIDDCRNSKVVNLFNFLKEKNFKVSISDPYANYDEVNSMYNIKLLPFNKLDFDYFNVIVHAVDHKHFHKIPFKKLKKNGKIIFDVKSVIKNDYIDGSL